MGVKYVIDSCVLIDAKRDDRLPMDIYISFWRELEKQILSGNIIIIDKVGDEIIKGTDCLAEWMKKIKIKLPKQKFESSNATEVVMEYKKVSNFAYLKTKNGFYKDQSSFNEFINVADSYLIAYALAKGCVLVTLEKPTKIDKYNQNPGNAKIKIPDICSGLNVTCIMPAEMLRRLRVSF